MVNVRQRSQEEVRSWADHQIPYLISYWQELPEIYAELDSWDIGEVQDYVEEWPLYEMFRRQIEDASQRGVLTPEQEREMDRLRSLVDQHGHLLKELLGHTN